MGRASEPITAERAALSSQDSASGQGLQRGFKIPAGEIKTPFDIPAFDWLSLTIHRDVDDRNDSEHFCAR